MNHLLFAYISPDPEHSTPTHNHNPQIFHCCHVIVLFNATLNFNVRISFVSAKKKNRKKILIFVFIQNENSENSPDACSSRCPANLFGCIQRNYILNQSWAHMTIQRPASLCTRQKHNASAQSASVRWLKIRKLLICTEQSQTEQTLDTMTQKKNGKNYYVGCEICIRQKGKCWRIFLLLLLWLLFGIFFFVLFISSGASYACHNESDIFQLLNTTLPKIRTNIERRVHAVRMKPLKHSNTTHSTFHFPFCCVRRVAYEMNN